LSIAISGSRDIPDRRSGSALGNPIRRAWQEQGGDPLDERLECPLGRLRLGGFLSEAEYEAGCKWRTIYHNWLKAIEAPSDLSDEKAESYEQAFKIGQRALIDAGKHVYKSGRSIKYRRIFDSVNALVVYESPEELGDFKSVAEYARQGLRVLVAIF
jgi:hypothetical protein